MARIRRILGLARAVIGLLISLASLIKLILSLVGEATNYTARCSAPTTTSSSSRTAHRSSSPPRWAGRWGRRCMLRCAVAGGPPRYFYHLRTGGHVGALSEHLHNLCFATLDISRFFDSVTRAKIHRALRSIGIAHDRAWEITQKSTVEKTLRQRDLAFRMGSSSPRCWLRWPSTAAPSVGR